MKNLPQNDDEYFQLLERIVKGADYLDHPLIKPADFAKGIRLYDELSQVARIYRAGGQADDLSTAASNGES